LDTLLHVQIIVGEFGDVKALHRQIPGSVTGHVTFGWIKALRTVLAEPEIRVALLDNAAVRLNVLAAVIRPDLSWLNDLGCRKKAGRRRKQNRYRRAN